MKNNSTVNLSQISIGSVVTYSQPLPQDAGLTYTVVEIEPAQDWCLIRANVPMNIQPTHTANISELILFLNS